MKDLLCRCAFRDDLLAGEVNGRGILARMLRCRGRGGRRGEGGWSAWEHGGRVTYAQYMCVCVLCTFLFKLTMASPRPSGGEP